MALLWFYFSGNKLDCPVVKLDDPMVFNLKIPLRAGFLN